MKPPFDSSGGSTPSPASDLANPAALGAPLPDGLTQGLPGGLPEVPDIPDLPTCLPGSCEALWNAVDKGMAPVSDAVSGVAKAANDAKDGATKVLDEAKSKASKAVDDAQEAVRQNVDMAKKYAELYQNDARQAWAGLTSIVTQQAGCALKDAAGLADTLAPGAKDAALGKVGQFVDDAGNVVDGGVKAAQDAAKGVTDKAKAAEDAASGFARDGADALAGAQKQVFDQIYPVTKFYADNGLDKLKECGSIPGRPEVPDALTDALEQIDKGTAEGIRAGSDMIAQYEQNSLVEKAVYEAERYRDQGLNDLAEQAEKLKSGMADAIPLSDTCGGPPLPFDGSFLDPAARERYYHKLMNEFETMGNDAKDKMIDRIAKQAMP